MSVQRQIFPETNKFNEVHTAQYKGISKCECEKRAEIINIIIIINSENYRFLCIPKAQ